MSAREALEAQAAASGAADLDTYTLARIIASEAGSSRSSDLERVGVAWAAWNRSRMWSRFAEFEAQGAPITARATFHVGRGVTWEYAGQRGRFVSTRLVPSAFHLAIADAVLRGELPDPTGGAQSFIEPSAQDRLLASGVAGYEKTASQVLQAWTAAGWKPTVVLGDTLFLKLSDSPPPSFDRDDLPRKQGFGAFAVAAAVLGIGAGLAWFARR